ncbi:hypothetical protein K7X08_025189 [Anisodus acutangulus]|uniref:BTB/POZ domain-containing protein n=1 Tax=Anisodus acutangulus TaxID=402998 RepID=A0A9Q1RDM4_9SOLA|nr:hypothetical protein K7X08_025189 [Anisodus acutangulus]
MGTSSSPKDFSVLSSPLSSPNVGALLKIKIISWSHETGLPVIVRVRIADKTFNLHKHPLFSKSGYFRRELNESNEVELPENFPGGAETFEMMALFLYGSSTLVDPFNVAALRCAAEFLEMTEEYCCGNLCECFDIYLNQVVLQSWDDTLIVLQKCQLLLPLAEELLIVSRCIESLAFMACMEILDPERRRDHPVVTLEALASQPWSSETVKGILNQDLWIKDLIALSFPLFKRIISSLRRQGMKEKYISPIILFYANKWVLSRKIHQYWQNNDAENDDDDDNDTKEKVSEILQGILDLLPMGERASKVIPVGFYFSLLSRSVQLGITSESREKLQDQIASLLYLARVEDFLLPENSNEYSISSFIELSIMKSIFSKYVSFSMELTHTPSPRNYIVAELWDVYLTKIATDPQWSSKRFLELIETVPLSSRQTHDHLYRALSTFLMAHPDMSQEEKGLVCKYLNCQKLSQEMCIEAVQNELMPLRLIVQALFVQQLNTQQAFKECSYSFRYANCGEYSGSLSSTIYPNSKRQNLVEIPYMEGSEGCSKPLSFLLKDSLQRSELSRKEYESTSFRIQSLEEELISLKKTLQLQHISKQTETISKKVEPISPNCKSLRPYGLEGRTPSKKRNTIGQVTSCMGFVNFSSQQRYATRLRKVFRRITLFGREKPRKKTGANGLRPKTLNF